jgi:hypothetical protein
VPLELLLEELLLVLLCCLLALQLYLLIGVVENHRTISLMYLVSFFFLKERSYLIIAEISPV